MNSNMLSYKIDYSLNNALLMEYTQGSREGGGARTNYRGLAPSKGPSHVLFLEISKNIDYNTFLM